MTEHQARYVENNTLISAHMPAIRIAVAEDMAYLGNKRFDLYGVAEADLYLFAAALDGVVQRLLWVQFEGFYPSNAKTYNYPVTNLARLGEHDFVHDFGLMNVSEHIAARPTGEWPHIVELAQQAGLTFGEQAAIQRFVRLLGDSRRNELMLIFAEDLSTTDLTPEDLTAAEAAPAQNPAFAARLLSRARTAFTISEG